MSFSRVLLWRSLLAIMVGVVALAWPGITVGAFVILFAVSCLIGAAMDAARAFGSERVGPVFGWLLLAALSAAAGVVAVLWPGITALVLTLTVGAWALATGAVEIVTAFRSGRTPGQRAQLALAGLVSVALAFALFVRPDIGAVSLATVFGLFNLAYGIVGVVTAFQLRRGGPDGGTDRAPADPRAAGT